MAQGGRLGPWARAAHARLGGIPCAEIDSSEPRGVCAGFVSKQQAPGALLAGGDFCFFFYVGWEALCELQSTCIMAKTTLVLRKPCWMRLEQARVH
jgi:hypothetical protein